MICVLFSIRRIVFLALAIALVGFSSLAVNRTEADEVRIAKRVPWQGSRVTGTPEPPPPFKSVRAFPHLKFDHPLLMVRYPQDDRLIVGEQSGVLYSFTEGTSGPASVFFDLRKEVTTVSQLSGAKEIEFVYGVAFHRQFTTNRQCFICYTIRGPGGEANLKDGTRVSRFTVTTADPPRVDPDSEQILLTWLQGGHNGGDLHFGPDGMLYISTGDTASPNPPDPLNTGQDISDLLSSILRIDVDRKDAGHNYAVPSDNPFVNMPKARPEVWAYGFRNPWRMSFDRQTGDLFAGDVGWELWESVHRITRGGNYGWAAMEGPQPIKPEQVGPTPVLPALIELPHSVACSVTGGVVYRGKRFPELEGAYVFGDWETRRLWAARFQDGRTVEMPELTMPSVRVVAFCENAAGEIYFIDHEAGTIHTLERQESSASQTQFPTKLSETGLFQSTADHSPAPGVQPYAINSPQWLDGAKVDRWIGFPELSAATLHAIPKPIPGLVDWHSFRMHFPQGAVLSRTLSLEGVRVETQLLHFDGIDWRAYTFAWKDDQSDAELVPADGFEKEFHVGNSTRSWQFLSRSQCMLCHNNQSEYALGFVPEQLNRSIGNRQNQLIALSAQGWIRRTDRHGKLATPFDTQSIEREQKLASPNDPTLPLEERTRSYLHANCAHCHSDNGGGLVPLRLSFRTTNQEMRALGERPTRGDFGLPNAQVIAPGDPYHSTLFFRMAKFGKDRMPHVGSEVPDEAGLELVGRWIESLQDQRAASADEPGSVPSELTDPSNALHVARRLSRRELGQVEQQAVLAAAEKLPGGPVRDLFEGYFPARDRGARKLGSNPKAQSILSVTGDAGRGETLFWSKQLECGKCHRVGDRGTAVGPELSTIGKQRSRSDLLESLLAPSRRVEPQFATFLAQLDDGRVVTGVSVNRDDKELVLRTAEGKDLTIPADTIEQLRPSTTSLMPDGQLAGLTTQEAADLLEYLSTRQ